MSDAPPDSEFATNGQSQQIGKAINRILLRSAACVDYKIL